MKTPHEKLLKLKETLKGYGKAAVAFSSGVDSTFLLKTAHDVLGDNVIAITVNMQAVPEFEIREAKEFCREQGIRHLVYDFDALTVSGFRNNPKDRCYHCKKAIFENMKSLALDNGFETVLEGSNTDDTSDYRPGMRAIRELNVKSPLMDAGLSKSDIRELSRQMNLKTWKKPSYACLASRIAYSEEITEEKLRMVEEAEKYLTGLGFSNFRVRMHGLLARIEPDRKDIKRFMEDDLRIKVTDKFRELGFSHVSLDLNGYETGSMNKVL